MRILGIDPGFSRIGFGIVDYASLGDFKYVTHGMITTHKENEFQNRLLEISTDVDLLLKKYNPDKVIIERLFFAKNTTTAMKVAEAKGVITLGVAKVNKPVIEITPLQVKMALTNDGRATKSDVKMMVEQFLSISNLKGLDDAIDALGIAIAGCEM